MARLRICHHCAKFTICGTLCDGTTPPSSCETSTPQSEVLPAARSNGADYPVAYEGMQDTYDKHLLTVERLFPSEWWCIFETVLLQSQAAAKHGFGVADN